MLNRIYLAAALCLFGVAAIAQTPSENQSFIPRSDVWVPAAGGRLTFYASGSTAAARGTYLGTAGTRAGSNGDVEMGPDDFDIGSADLSASPYYHGRGSATSITTSNTVAHVQGIGWDARCLDMVIHCFDGDIDKRPIAGGSSASLASMITDETGSGRLVFNLGPTLRGTVTLNGLNTLVGGFDAIATLNLSTAGAAVSGIQYYSSPLVFTASGFDTGASAARPIDWRVYNKPTQGNPAMSALTFDYQYNAGGYANRATINSDGTFSFRNSATGVGSTLLTDTGGNQLIGFGSGASGGSWTPANDRPGFVLTNRATGSNLSGGVQRVAFGAFSDGMYASTVNLDGGGSPDYTNHNAGNFQIGLSEPLFQVSPIGESWHVALLEARGFGAYNSSIKTGTDYNGLELGFWNHNPGAGAAPLYNRYKDCDGGFLLQTWDNGLNTTSFANGGLITNRLTVGAFRPPTVAQSFAGFDPYHQMVGMQFVGDTGEIIFGGAAHFDNWGGAGYPTDVRLLSYSGYQLPSNLTTPYNKLSFGSYADGIPQGTETLYYQFFHDLANSTFDLKDIVNGVNLFHAGSDSSVTVTGTNVTLVSGNTGIVTLTSTADTAIINSTTKGAKAYTLALGTNVGGGMLTPFQGTGARPLYLFLDKNYNTGGRVVMSNQDISYEFGLGDGFAGSKQFYLVTGFDYTNFDLHVCDVAADGPTLTIGAGQNGGGGVSNAHVILDCLGTTGQTADLQRWHKGAILEGVVSAAGNATFAGVLTMGSGPTTITDSTGKVLAAALNTVTAAKGGTGLDTSASSGVAQVSGGTWSVSNALPSATTATTQSTHDSSTKPATTAFVDTSLPTRATLTHLPRKAVSGSFNGYYSVGLALRDVTDTSDLSTNYIDTVSEMLNQNDSFSQTFDLASGTYDIFVIAWCDTSMGKVQLAIDDTNVGGLLDTYRSAIAWKRLEVNSVSISAGKHKLTCTTDTTKNGSSSNYFQYIGPIYILPHGAD